MPNKKKKFFTKHNSTKYVLFTEGRNADGEKITENVLVPVPQNHVPGSSLLLSNIPAFCNKATDSKKEDENSGKGVSQPTKAKNSIEPTTDKDADLERILEQMEDSDEITDSDDEDYEAVTSKIKEFTLRDLNSKHLPSNVQIEILEEGSDFSDDFGQFSDAESDESDDNFAPRLPKSNLTSSSRADCPESIKMLNEGFEKVLAEYDDDLIGALDDEEIGGSFTTDNERVMSFISTPLNRIEEHIEIGEVDNAMKKKILFYTEVEEPEKFVEITTKQPLEFDCESILSLYSNKYNHPVVIKEESKIRKISIPYNPLKKRLTRSQLKQLDSASESEEEDDADEKASMATSFNIRIKDETPEQRKERKRLFREARRESRCLKKENKLAFKNEKKLQKAQAINARNIKGIKLT